MEHGYYKGTILRRYFAAIIDGFILIPVAVATYFLVSNSNLLSLIITLISWIYQVLTIWKYGTTFGKNCMSLEVVSTSYKRPTLGRIIIRETIGKLLSTYVFSLGFFWALWDKNSQTWHDKLARTYVVTKLPNNGKESRLLLIVVGGLAVVIILSFLATVILVIVNPSELTKKARDAVRMADLAMLDKAITQAKYEGRPLCASGEIPCGGNSNILDASIRDMSGKGWVKVNLQNIPDFLEQELPIDPKNNGNHKYHYCSDGKDWEIFTVLESKQWSEKAKTDGGINPELFEVGSNLELCSKP